MIILLAHADFDAEKSFLEQTQTIGLRGPSVFALIVVAKHSLPSRGRDGNVSHEATLCPLKNQQDK